MEQKPTVENINSSLKSSLDPSTENVVETPEPQPEEFSDDYEVDPTDPDTIDPELINTPGLNPEGEDEAEEEIDPDLDLEIPDPIKRDINQPTPEEVIRVEIDAGIRDPNSISNPDAGI